MQLSVHRVIFARAIDPGLVVLGEGDRPFHVDEVRRLLSDDDDVVVKLLGFYTNRPSRREWIDAAPETEFKIAPSSQQLERIWGLLVDSVRRAIDDWDRDDDDPAPWKVFDDGGQAGVEIQLGGVGGRFMVRLVENRDAAAGDDAKDSA